MRVCHLGKFYPPINGGMERFLQSLCEEEASSCQSRVLVASSGPRTTHQVVNGVSVSRIACYGSVRSVAICPSFPYWVSKQQADLFVLHEPNPLATLSYLLTKPEGKLIVWFHSEVVRQARLYRLYRPFMRHALQRAEKIVVSSPALSLHAQELQDFRAKLTVIPFGIDLAHFASNPEVSRRAQSLRSRLQAPLILFVGRMVTYKGVDILLRAMQHTDATLTLVGTGPLLPSLKDLARQLGIEQRTFFLGDVEEQELVSLYHACDVFVLPSIGVNEAFGIVQLEAMACGKPVVSTDLASGVPWVNQHGETGLVVPPGDVDALRAALASLIESESLRSEMGARARQRVDNEFTKERMADLTINLYRQVASSP